MQYDSKLQQIVNNGYFFDMGEYFNRGFELFKKNLWGFVGFTAIYIAIIAVASLIPAGGLVSLFIQPILLAGFYIVANDMLRNNPVDFNRFFKGFDFAMQLIIANLMVGLFVFIGILAFIIPGIYLAVSYSFTPFFIIFLGYDFWPAMEWSRKIVTQNFWSILGFVIVMGLINVIGLLFLGIGLLFTMPLTACITYSAFEDIVGKTLHETV